MSIEERLNIHRDFWNHIPLKKPLTSIHLGNNFMSTHFRANEKLLKRGTVVTPDMIQAESFMDDYERMYANSLEINQDGFFVGTPCTGFPWMEAIYGCQVVGEEVSFVSRPQKISVKEAAAIEITPETNEWYQKYIEFLASLRELSGHRFPLGQPILRGVSDTLGAIIGQEQMALALIDEPELVKQVFQSIAAVFKKLIQDAYRFIDPFYDGYAIGFYDIWTPGKAIWYQEDLASIMSPRHFDKFLRASCEYRCEGYPFTLEHLHPSAFFHLKGILKLEGLRAVQVNKEDFSIPTVPESIPQYQQILAAGKSLLIQGALNKDDIDCLHESLGKCPIALRLVCPTIDDANDLCEYINTAYL